MSYRRAVPAGAACQSPSPSGGAGTSSENPPRLGIEVLECPHCLSLVRAGLLELFGTTVKVHPPYQSKEEAGASACITLLVLPACAVPRLRQAEPGPALPASFNGAT